MESCSGMKGVNGRLAMREVEVRMIWKEYFEDLYNIDAQKQVSVHVRGFDGIRRENYLERESIMRTEVEVRMGKLKNGKAAGRNEVTGEMIKK